MIKPFDRLGFDTPDFLSVILPAQASKAKVAGLADTHGDVQNALEYASELGLRNGGRKIGALMFDVTDAHILGLRALQGMIATGGYCWDMNDAMGRGACREDVSMARQLAYAGEVAGVERGVGLPPMTCGVPGRPGVSTFGSFVAKT
jgi:hypothetical protein